MRHVYQSCFWHWMQIANVLDAGCWHSIKIHGDSDRKSLCLRKQFCVSNSKFIVYLDNGTVTEPVYI